jgi:hypothetical protein
LPFLVKDHMHAGVETLGLLYATFPAGYVLGGLWLGRATTLRHRGLIAFGGVLVAGLMIFLFGLSLPLAILLLAALLNGAALEMAGLAWTNILQACVPGEKLGRVASIDMLGSSVLLPIGYGVAGWATAALGPAAVCALGGSGTLICALAALANPQIRCLD